jgi:hypothetical protein
MHRSPFATRRSGERGCTGRGRSRLSGRGRLDQRRRNPRKRRSVLRARDAGRRSGPNQMYDSAEDGTARFTAHSAFEDPTAPANVLARFADSPLEGDGLELPVRGRGQSLLSRRLLGDGSVRPLASTARGVSTPTHLRQELAVWPRPDRRGPDRRGRNPTTFSRPTLFGAILVVFAIGALIPVHFGGETVGQLETVTGRFPAAA